MKPEGAETCEQVPHDPRSPWWGEHRSRYLFATEHDLGDLVIDVACGTGLGWSLLVGPGRTVLGFDISWEAVLQAHQNSDETYHVSQASGLRLPVPDDTASAIVSFETLEHVADADTFVAEIRRILREDGLLVLSTPNALFTKPVGGVPTNPFHVYEFQPDELKAMLGRHFGEIELFGQRPDPNYGSCPFWEKPGMVPATPGSPVKTMAWKALARFPVSAREFLSKHILGRPFYPGERDFSFSPTAMERCHVLVAVCRP